ncbi:hypothetical protein, partial [Novosphingobium sp.]|uniref:hypothetical protein n=1 Tax=Novosphingobium sp. TaxID=1874826 RepID=UPI0025F77CBE
PVGLFLLYYLFAGISDNVLAYQIPAWLFASATAWVIARIAARWTNAQGALLAGASYLFMLGPLEGFGGQTPVFYNLMIAGAAWLVLQSLPALDAGKPGWRMLAAMALAGAALTFKQTTMFEAAFFGLFAAWRLWQSDVNRWRAAGWIAVWIIVGLAPTASAAAWYAIHGYWASYYSAMVTANLKKTNPSVIEIATSALALILRLYPILAISLLGLKLPDQPKSPRTDVLFSLLWIAASICGIATIPNFYTHYALPGLAPIVVLCGLAMGRREIGVFLFAFVAAFTLLLYPALNTSDHRQSINGMAAMSEAIREHGGERGVLIYDGPPLLYVMSRTHPLSPLAFPPHLNHWRERNVSQFNTQREVINILQKQPGVIVTTVTPTYTPGNGQTRQIVMDYAFNNCQLILAKPSFDLTSYALIAIFADCAPRPYTTEVRFDRR